jgi:SulP family sulfate permease
MLATFGTALFVPLQWTIFIGAAISLFAFLEERHKLSSSTGLERSDDGRWRVTEIVTSLTSNDIAVVDYRGSGFFAEIPPLRRRIPVAADAESAVLILRIHAVQRINSTFETLIRGLTSELRATGNHLILEGVRPEVMATLVQTGTIEIIGVENVIPAGDVLTGGLDAAWARAVFLAHGERASS